MSRITLSLKGAWIGYKGEKSSSGSVSFKWVDPEYGHSYTKWGFNQPDSNHISNGQSAYTYISTFGQYWMTGMIYSTIDDIILCIDSTSTTTLPYVCRSALEYKRPNDDRGDLLDCDATKGWYPSSTNEGKGHYCIKVFTDKKPFYEADHTCSGSPLMHHI